LKTTYFVDFFSKVNFKLKKMQEEEEEEEEKYNIICLKDGKGEPYTLTVLSSCCYQKLEACSHLVLTNCRSS
jgi:hypothetical protein